MKIERAIQNHEQKLRNLEQSNRSLTQRSYQDTGGAGQGGGASTMRVGITSSTITARSGMMPGSGSVDLLKLVGGSLTSLETVTAYNMGDVVDADIATHCYKNIDGNWWVSPEECSNG